jgi:hypothetical protein
MIFLYRFTLFLLDSGATQGSDRAIPLAGKPGTPQTPLESTVPRLCEFPIAKEKCDENSTPVFEPGFDDDSCP